MLFNSLPGIASAGWRAARNRVLQQIAALGRTAWRVCSG